MPSLLHRLDVEHLDLDAELAQRAGAARELDRIEHVGRLVDEIARHEHAVGDGRRALQALRARRDIGDARA